MAQFKEIRHEVINHVANELDADYNGCQILRHSAMLAEETAYSSHQIGGTLGRHKGETIEGIEIAGLGDGLWKFTDTRDN